MSNKHFEQNENSSEKENQEVVNEETTNLQEEKENLAEETNDADKVSAELAELQKKYDELNNSHLRLMAEFDNYRKRTLREKSELIKNGGENALTQLLPVVDDFERALQNIHKAEDLTGVAEGVDLIYNKFVSYLASQGVKAMEVVGKPFDLDQSEAIATIPAPEEGLKGKVLDCVQTGYLLNEKVIRHAKVVVGE
ncbi:MAG: nucleotide exchange factor GrpE [Parabacteroides sp.]|uniref:Protein GrpE n=1 Tax=Parabacteroides faecalis TaxID=2924040 RepID=A0ABT0C0Q9_9BACT|nr:nucleotide exchange factor GrpE [Parabacteroides faecalis]MCI7287378.1 nucleotide exchange factor GrpE [Parabacteroides sp.]MDY6255552.1 nucleotide exchange factor GrpE [Bacteroidales bacterium]MCI7359019.1 nucleotide exchange factor GrpE [Parabacteroides sp.]MCJ2380592.1 nucleotide exchange factor GrpE [Parabacteroides faecalis]MDD7561541.1 nucleotide exchange factor GrpE [Parabacteroides sp.]